MKPKPTSRSETSRQTDTAIALVIAGVGTWALPKFLLVPLFQAFGWHFSWWIYAILFLILFGSGMSALTKQRAEENIAYDNTVVKVDDRTRFCTQCGHEIESSARFCPNCGVKTE
jgi:hypothetical protein